MTGLRGSADAGRVSVDLRHTDGEWKLEVRDDGRGGADPTGSGLTGLADRVAAIGGRLEVEGLQQGTLVRATTRSPVRRSREILDPPAPSTSLGSPA